MGNLSPEEQAKLEKDCKEEFDKIDTDKSGLIDKDEFRKLIEKIAKNTGGEMASEKDIDDAFKELDLDNSGKISFDEFRKQWFTFSFLIQLSKEKKTK